jgi:hypothetical protein
MLTKQVETTPVDLMQLMPAMKAGSIPSSVIVQIECHVGDDGEPRLSGRWTPAPKQVAIRFWACHNLESFAEYFSVDEDLAADGLDKGLLWLVPEKEAFRFVERMGGIWESFSEWDEIDIAAGSTGDLEDAVWHELSVPLPEDVA